MSSFIVYISIIFTNNVLNCLIQKQITCPSSTKCELVKVLCNARPFVRCDNCIRKVLCLKPKKYINGIITLNNIGLCTGHNSYS